MDAVHRWGRFETTLRSGADHAEPTQNLDVRAEFVAPSGARHTVRGFWDGGRTWRVRMSRDEFGIWSYTTRSRPADPGLDGVAGQFECVAYDGTNAFFQRGAVRVAGGGRHFVHADGTPFFYLADTAWTGAMQSTETEWATYLADRADKKFTAVQYLSSPFRACATTATGHSAYEGRERIQIVPEFFQWLDPRVDAINDHGLLAVPLLLHAGTDTTLNPGHHLPADQAIVLTRYLVARYGAHHVLWDLVAEADYHGAAADAWRYLGRATFDLGRRHPVTLHPNGLDWVLDEFADEDWMDVVGYQIGHDRNETSWRWIVDGPPSTAWREPPARPFVNLEPPYEGLASYFDGPPLQVTDLRRACYWSLLLAPTAGLAYGAHSVAVWDGDNSGAAFDPAQAKSPPGSADTASALPWWQAMHLPGASSMTRIAELMATIDWWQLRPCPQLLVEQPGAENVQLTVAAARADDGSFAVLYVPDAMTMRLDKAALPTWRAATWFDPRTGGRMPAQGADAGDTWEFTTPGEADWVLILSAVERTREGESARIE